MCVKSNNFQDPPHPALYQAVISKNEWMDTYYEESKHRTFTSYHKAKKCKWLMQVGNRASVYFPLQIKAL